MTTLLESPTVGNRIDFDSITDPAAFGSGDGGVTLDGHRVADHFVQSVARHTSSRTGQDHVDVLDGYSAEPWGFGEDVLDYLDCNPTLHRSVPLDVPDGVDAGAYERFAGESESDPSAPTGLDETPAEAGFLDERDASDIEFASLAADAYDARGSFARHANLGKQAATRLAKAKASLPPGVWNGKKDASKQFSRMADVVRMRYGIAVELDKDVRAYHMGRILRTTVPNVSKLRWGIVHGVLLSTVEFDADTLTAEVKAGWGSWLAETTAALLGENPPTNDEVKASKLDHAAFLKAEADRKRKPVDAAEEVRRAEVAAEKKRIAAKNSAMTAITKSVDSAIGDRTLKPSDVGDVMAMIAKTHNVAIPGAFDAATATVNDVRALATALLNAEKIAEMIVLRNMLTMMIDASGEQMSKAS